MDQNEQRDHAEEAFNRATAEREGNEYGHYTAGPHTFDPETPTCIRIGDDDAELEFFIESAAWPTLREKIDAAYEEITGKQDLEEAFDNVQQSLDDARHGKLSEFGNPFAQGQ